MGDAQQLAVRASSFLEATDLQFRLSEINLEATTVVDLKYVDLVDLKLLAVSCKGEESKNQNHLNLNLKLKQIVPRRTRKYDVL